MSELSTWWERWLHATVRDSPELRRSALVISVGACFATLFMVAQITLSLSLGHLVRAAPGLLFLAAPMGCFALLKVRPTPTAAGHLLCATSSVLITIAVAGEDALYAGTIAWFGVVSALAIISLSLRAGLMWAGVDLLIVGAVEAGRQAGLITPWLSSAPSLTALRGVGLIVAFVTLAALFDRTRRQAFADAERLTRSKSNFLANISHELRTPMNGVLGLTDLLLSSELSAEQREHLELLQRSGRGLVVLLNDLLDMSKVEAGKMQLDPTDFDLGALLADVKALHEPVAHARGLEFVLNRPAVLPRAVRGDEMRLRQVLTNLVSNATKFTLKGGVFITLEAKGEQYDFTVRDSGIGIAAKALPHLFTAFAQAEAGTTRRFGGTGLGLALSRELVSLMGGTLVVQSQESVGTALSFSLVLPASLGSLLDHEPAPTEPKPDDTALPVLVVDDNPINLRVACGLVQKAGYRTLTATNGAQALELVQREPVGLVLMDCHMPVMDGFEATERIRCLEGDAALVPIIALTASAMPEELERCRVAGMNDCLIKPVTLEQLTRTLGQVRALRDLMTLLT